MKIKPQHQTILNDPKKNDCLRACIATLLGMRIAKVPNFVEVDDESWWMEMQRWLKTKGFQLVFMPLLPNVPWHPVMDLVCIIIGLSPDYPEKINPNELHAVIGHVTSELGSDLKWDSKNEIIHDPDPRNPGLRNITALAFLVPIFER